MTLTSNIAVKSLISGGLQSVIGFSWQFKTWEKNDQTTTNEVVFCDFPAFIINQGTEWCDDELIPLGAI